MSESESKFPGRPPHAAPLWVPEAAIFHIRIRAEKSSLLTEPWLARRLLDSVEFYSEQGRWWAWIFLLMPDHLHALLSFPVEERISDVVGDWKRFHARQHGVLWQENYFDHRLRREESFAEKAAYVCANPVVKGLVASADDWPWKLVADGRQQT